MRMFDRYCCLDLEMTGLSAKKDRVVALCAYEMAQAERTGRKFSVILNPDRAIPLRTERVHGLSTEDVQDKPRFAEIAHDLVLFLGDAPIVVHAGLTDGRDTDEVFLNKELQLAGYPAIPAARFVNQKLLAREIFGKSALNDVLDVCGIDRSARVAHGADIDAFLLTQSYPMVVERHAAYKKIRNDFAKARVSAFAGLAALIEGQTPKP